MSLQCNGQLQIKCNNCGTIESINCSDLDFQEESENNDRQQGRETIYEAIIDYNCSSCGDPIKGTYNVSEYPQDSFDSDDINISGGTVIQTCNYTFV